MDKNVTVETTTDNPVSSYLEQVAQAILGIAQEQVWQVVNVLYQAWQAGCCVFLCGNGGSAATASHMANDLCKLTIVPGKPRLKAIALTDNVPLLTAWGNDSEYADVFAEQLLNFVQPDDVLVAISASGNSPNVLRAVQAANENGARTVAFSGRDGGKLKQLVEICICIPDDHIGRQEDGHMVLDHVIASTLRWLIEREDSLER